VHLDLAPIRHQANGAIGSATPAELVTFAHAALFSPALSTLAAALNKVYLSNFTGLTTKTLQKYPPQSVPMVKGHLRQTRQNQCSTKPTTATKPTPEPPSSEPIDLQDNFPSSETPNIKTQQCYTAVMETTGQIHSEQTGRFVVPSSTGNNYLLIVYDYNSNAILAEPMRTPTSASIIKVYQAVHARLSKSFYFGQDSNASITNVLPNTRNSCARNASITSLFLLAVINATPRNAPSKPSRIILLLDCAILINIYGISLWGKRNSLSTYFAVPAHSLTYPPMLPCMVRLISIAHCWRHLAFM
jgi:hypothetical protein